MLVDTMDHIEITNEIKKDKQKIYATTLLRLGEEYERERKKLKIEKKRTYTKEYCIKTAKKNNWIIFLRKAPSKEIFKNKYDLQVTSIVYYYNNTGLRVFNCTNIETLAVYNGHFFTRYNERLKLNLSKPLDIVKHFFRYNSYMARDLVKKNRRYYVISFCRDGLVLGELQYGFLWLVNKTFVSKDLLKPEQDEAEKEIIAELQQEIIFGMGTGKLSEATLMNQIDRIKALDGLSMD